MTDSTLPTKADTTPVGTDPKPVVTTPPATKPDDGGTKQTVDLSQLTDFKNMYQNEVVRHERTKRKALGLMAVVVLQILAMAYILFVQNRLMVTLKETHARLVNQIENNYVVWQMDSSCFAQLKSANMIQLLIKD